MAPIIPGRFWIRRSGDEPLGRDRQLGKLTRASILSGEALLLMEKEDLKDLGISIGHIKVVLDHIHRISTP